MNYSDMKNQIDWNDKKSVIEAVQNGWTLDEASQELKADREVVLEAVRTDGRSLRSASKELRANREVVLEAVQHYGWSIEYASDELRADKELLLHSVKDDPDNIAFASKDLRELCKDKDPVQALEAAIRMERMQEQLKPKPPSQKRGLKI